MASSHEQVPLNKWDPHAGSDRFTVGSDRQTESSACSWEGHAVLSANADEAKRCVHDANLLLLGAANWGTSKRMDMIRKAIRLLNKAHQMSKCTIPSVPQWLTMRGSAVGPDGKNRLSAETVQAAIRLYAQCAQERRDNVAQQTSPVDETSVVHENGVRRGARITWNKLQYFVFDWTGLGQFFTPEWKPSILAVYLLVVVLAVARWVNGAPLTTLIWGSRRSARGRAKEAGYAQTDTNTFLSDIREDDTANIDPYAWFSVVQAVLWIFMVIIPILVTLRDAET